MTFLPLVGKGEVRGFHSKRGAREERRGDPFRKEGEK